VSTTLDDAMEAACARAVVAAIPAIVAAVVAGVVPLVVEELAPRLPLRIFDIRDTGRVLGKVSTATIKRMIADGELRTLKVRGRTMCDLTTVRGLDQAEISALAAEVHEPKARKPKKTERNGSPPARAAAPVGADA
jgi:hypothetical protein